MNRDTEQARDLLRWRMPLSETLSFAVAAVMLTIWMINNFQSKSEADEREKRIDTRISAVESRMSQVAVDVSYIRGRLEPKEKDK